MRLQSIKDNGMVGIDIKESEYWSLDKDERESLNLVTNGIVIDLINLIKNFQED
jgi:hypothetical protein